MPFAYRVSPDERLVHCELTGAYDITETQQLFRELCASGVCPEGWGVLVDVTRRQGAPTAQGIAALVLTLEAMSSRMSGRIAFLTGWKAQYGMARMLEIRAEMAGLPLRAFEDEGEALVWLRGGGLPGLKGGTTGA